MALDGPLWAYIGRENVEKLELLHNGERVPKNSITRAIIRFGTYCLDTELHNEIELTEDAQVLEIKLGLIPDLVSGKYKSYITIYPNLAEDGIAWASANVRVAEWPVCPT